MRRDGSPCRRISVRSLQKRGYSELYALRALDVAALDVGGMDLLDRYEKRIALEDPFLQTADDMSFFCHGDGAFLKLDQDGRITVSDFIREHTGITADVAFVGRGNFFQIWEPERLKAYGARGALPACQASAGATQGGWRGKRNDGGPRRGYPRRWRTGPPHSGPPRRGARRRSARRRST